MDRREWGEMLGDEITVEADLRWLLFQAERSIATMDREREETEEADDFKAPAGVTLHRVEPPRTDGELYRINQRRVRHARVALAHLWLRADKVFEIEGNRGW